MNQEGLPDYWGIETPSYANAIISDSILIRKDYPTTGVLKLICVNSIATGVLKLILSDSFACPIRKDYPTTGVLKPFMA